MIVEDEVLVAEDTASDLESEGFQVNGIAISAEEALTLIAEDVPHIILMDINIKGEMDGISLAEKIHESHHIPIIYVSSNTSSRFINRALETKPHAFISKPYNKKDLIIAIELAMSKQNEATIDGDSAEVDSIFVKSGEYHRKVLLQDILYIEADGSYCNVYTKEAMFTLSFNLNHFQNEVKAKDLLRVHRSYVVNLKRVEGFDRTTLLIGEKIIPVSNSYKNEVFEYFKKV